MSFVQYWGRSITKSSRRVGHEYGMPYNGMPAMIPRHEEFHCRLEVSATKMILLDVCSIRNIVSDNLKCFWPFIMNGVTATIRANRHPLIPTRFPLLHLLLQIQRLPPPQNRCYPPRPPQSFLFLLRCRRKPYDLRRLDVQPRL